VIVPGANNDVTAEFVESKRHVIESARVVVTQLEVPLAATIRALEIAANSPGTTAIFNPAPADAALPDSIFALSDLVIPNETEASLLSGVQVTDVASAEAAARVLLAKGAKNVIVTLGGQGCLLVPGGNARGGARAGAQGGGGRHDGCGRLVYWRVGTLHCAWRLAGGRGEASDSVRVVLGAATRHTTVVCNERRH
jgi:sugar/nucleoside kinase (ribokinase family)